MSNEKMIKAGWTVSGLVHVRLHNPLFSHVLFGVYVGIALWVGLYLREPRLRALLPLAS